jgi:two-component system chemotaxis response regulator CheY
MKNILRRIGFENIDEANNGENGYSKLLDKRFSLVISDWNTSKINGNDHLIKKVRYDSNLKYLPIIILTDKQEEELMLDTFFQVNVEYKEGVDNWLLKPINADSLTEKIEEIIAANYLEI